MHEPERKKRIKTWFNYLFDSCCCCTGVLAVYYQYMKKLQFAGYRAYTDDGDGKTGCKDMDAGYPETPKRLLKLFGRINQCIYNKNYLTMTFQRLLENSVCFYCESLQKKNSQDKMESEISAGEKISSEKTQDY